MKPSPIRQYAFFVMFGRNHDECLVEARGSLQGKLLYGLPIAELDPSNTEPGVYHLRQATNRIALLPDFLPPDLQFDKIDEFDGIWEAQQPGEHEAHFSIFEVPEVQVKRRLGHGMLVPVGFCTGIGTCDESMKHLIAVFSSRSRFHTAVFAA